MSEVIILMFCQTGFGDHYSSLITGYNAFLDIKKLGLTPKLVVAKGHKYFPQNIDLSVIYDFSSFGDEVIQMNYDEIDNFTKGYELCLFTSIQIWAKKKSERLQEYVQSHKFISRYNRDLLSHEPNTNFKIFHDELMSFSDSFVSGKKEIIGLHFRGGDDTLVSNIDEIINHSFWGGELKRMIKIIGEYPNNDIMICSLNKSVREYFSNKFENVFSPNIGCKELPFHNIVANNQILNNVENYINHSKEILAEMVSFRHCKKIYSFNTFPSNFVLYGILNNVNYSLYRDKLKTSII